MKKIISGKLYDTDTARKVSSWDNGFSYSDFNYAEEALFRKRTGEYFLFGEGGPNTKYARRVDSNSWSSGSEIVPLSFDDARLWAEKHMDADSYMREFGPVEDDETRVSLNLSLPASTVDIIRREASRQGISVSEFISQKVLSV